MQRLVVFGDCIGQCVIGGPAEHSPLESVTDC